MIVYAIVIVETSLQLGEHFVEQGKINKRNGCRGRTRQSRHERFGQSGNVRASSFGQRFQQLGMNGRTVTWNGTLAPKLSFPFVWRINTTQPLLQHPHCLHRTSLFSSGTFHSSFLLPLSSSCFHHCPHLPSSLGSLLFGREMLLSAQRF
mmetsp:Transcript_36988/g.55318  ORF Transcript_36988/g.55318 Transcript_36988/m.55318 type:complete len:150 (+) Transcript_36988:2120-2569(+)